MNIDHWTPVQKTLLIPLLGRAMALKKHPDLGFRDELAEEIVANLELHDFKGLYKDKKSIWGSVIRAKVFDQTTISMLKENTNLQIINIGCGLCSRAWRLQKHFSTDTKWVEWDFPEVIAVKKELFPAHKQLTYCDKELSNSAVLLEVIEQSKQDSLIIMEGVFMFFEPENAKQILTSLGSVSHKKTTLLLDYIAPPILKISNIHPSLKLTKAKYSYAMAPLSTLPNHIEVLKDKLFTSHYKGFIGIVDKVLRAIFKGSLYDVVLLKVNKGHE